MRSLALAWVSCSLLTACSPCLCQPPAAAPAAPAAAPASPAAANANANTNTNASANANAEAPAPIHALSEVPEDAIGATSAPVPGFMRGINLGNGLDAPIEGAWGVVLKPEHFAMAKAAGLDHVRLPVRFSAHALDAAPYTVEEALFKRVDWAVDQALAHGLSIIIDLHHYEELMKKPHDHAARLTAIWKQIAARYKGRPATVAFELINEPCDELKSPELNPITKQALAAVRASNPTRTVFVDSYFWASADRLKELELPEDANVVPSFHMYQPILFTHQGMPWMGPEFQSRPVVFPGPPAAPVTPVPAAQSTGWVSAWFSGYNTLPVAQNPGGPKAVFDYFKVVEEYVTSSHRRVYMGEFGVADTVDAKSRENWLRLVKTEAERRHIGWALWDDGGKFKAMNIADGSWTAPIQAGLFH